MKLLVFFFFILLLSAPGLAFVGQECTDDWECDQSSSYSICVGGRAEEQVERCDTTYYPGSCEVVTDYVENCGSGCCSESGGVATCNPVTCDSNADCVDPNPNDCTTYTCQNAGTCGSSCVATTATPLCPNPWDVLCGEPIEPINGCPSGCPGLGTKPYPGETCVLNQRVRCGDGITNAFAGEQCDLGSDPVSGLSLNRDCTGNTGPSCSSSCTNQVCGLPGYCGDGTVDTTLGEQCDGGNLNGATCTFGGLPTCIPAGQPNECRLDYSNCPVCGDGILNLAGEQCDCAGGSCVYAGGNTCADHGQPGGGTLISCSGVGWPPPPFFSGCMIDFSHCGSVTPPAPSGPPSGTCVGGSPNGIAEAGEQCDTGSPGPGYMPQTVCTQLGGWAGGALSCTSSCTYDISACTPLAGSCSTDSSTLWSCPSGPGAAGDAECLAQFSGVTGSGDRYDCITSARAEQQNIECRADNFCWFATQGCEYCPATGKECGCIGSLCQCRNPPPPPPAPEASIDSLSVGVRRSGSGSYVNSLTTTHPSAIDTRVSWTISNCAGNCDLTIRLDCTNDGVWDYTTTQNSQSSESDSVVFTCPQGQYPNPTSYVPKADLEIVKGLYTSYNFAQGSVNFLPPCGNGNIDAGEQCDGLNLNGQSCVSQGFDSGILACDLVSCNFNTDSCYGCGNDVAEGTESCDGTDLKGLDCTDFGFGSPSGLSCNSCGIVTSGCGTCSNNIVEGAETCDDGNTVNGDGCSSLCQVEPTCTGIEPAPNVEIVNATQLSYIVNITGVSDATAVNVVAFSALNGADDEVTYSAVNLGSGKWQATITTANHPESGTVQVQAFLEGSSTTYCGATNYYHDLCGNNFIDAGGSEVCDGTAFTTTCSDYGYYDGTLGCTSACQVDTVNCNSCGNGSIDVGEQCDEIPNGDDADGCTDSCRYPTVDATIVSAVPDPTDRIDITTVKVETNVPRINCVGVSASGRNCVFHEWEAGTDYAVFNCTSGVSCLATETFEPFVDTAPVKQCNEGTIGPDWIIGVNDVTESTPARCTNGYDDDCDGLIDAVDTDCWASMSGYVTNELIEPLPSATVSVLVSLANRLVATNGVGYYSIADIPPGEHSITIVKPGYQSQTVSQVFPEAVSIDRNFTLTNGSCLACANWEGRCSVACSGAPQCGATVPSVCDGISPGEWRHLNSTQMVQCCTAVNTKPVVNSSFELSGCMDDIITHERLVKYQGELVSLRVYTWVPCE